MKPSQHVKRPFLTALLLVLFQGLFSQTITLTLCFDGANNGEYVDLARVKVKNLTRGGESSISAPVTMLTLELVPGDTILFAGYIKSFPVGMQTNLPDGRSFHLSQNYPNPAADQSKVSLYLPAPGTVALTMRDMKGNSGLRREITLDKGTHIFRVCPASPSLCVLHAEWNGNSRSIKIMPAGNSYAGEARIDYLGPESGENRLKATGAGLDLIEVESGILDTPTQDRSYTFQFASNFPCPGIPTVTYEGKLYHTVQIFSQCWLKENLNVGTMLEVCTDQTNNGYLEKYCYGDTEDSCTKYGGLYQWQEMMQYVIQQGGQGICPPGWHVPTWAEFHVLTGVADSQYEVGDPILDTLGISGFDAGTNLKATSGWAPYTSGTTSGNGTDLYGFTGLAGGHRDFFGCSNYGFSTEHGYWWTSTPSAGRALAYIMRYDYTTVLRAKSEERESYSVRCLKNPN